MDSLVSKDRHIQVSVGENIFVHGGCNLLTNENTENIYQPMKKQLLNPVQKTFSPTLNQDITTRLSNNVDGTGSRIINPLGGILALLFFCRHRQNKGDQ